MKIKFASTSANDENVTFIDVHTEVGETIKKGDIVTIELRDGSSRNTEVVKLKPFRFGDPEPESIEEDNDGQIVVLGIPSNQVRTIYDAEENYAEENYFEKYFCLTPYKELLSGDASIHDFVGEKETVPDKVIAYLKTTKPYMMSPGIYEHPFKEGKELLGPYWYTDGEKYFWDRDTWKYVVKYGLKLPKDFIDYVMSEKGTEFLKKFDTETNSWSNEINKMKEMPNTLCLLPDDAGDEALEDF